MKISISTEGVERAADELAACGKRLNYTAAGIGEDLNSPGGDDPAVFVDVEKVRLRKQQQILERDARKIEMMADVLRRVSEEIDSAEGSILDHEAEVGAGEKTVGMNDLDRIGSLIEEAVKPV